MTRIILSKIPLIYIYIFKKLRPSSIHLPHSSIHTSYLLSFRMYLKIVYFVETKKLLLKVLWIKQYNKIYKQYQNYIIKFINNNKNKLNNKIILIFHLNPNSFFDQLKWKFFTKLRLTTISLTIHAIFLCISLHILRLQISFNK